MKSTFRFPAAVLAALALILPPAAAEGEQTGGTGNLNPQVHDCCTCIILTLGGKPRPDGNRDYSITIHGQVEDGERCGDVGMTGFELSGPSETIEGSMTGKSGEVTILVTSKQAEEHDDEWILTVFCGPDAEDAGDGSQPTDPDSVRGCSISFEIKPAGCESGACEDCPSGPSEAGYDGESFNVTVPTTARSGGMTAGNLRYHTADFANPGRSALIPNVPSNFTVNRDAAGIITSVETDGLTLLTVGDAPPDVMTADPNAFAITHKDPAGDTFRTTTVSFINEGGEDRLRMDTVFDNTATRHELTLDADGDPILEKGHVTGGTIVDHFLTGGTFESIRRETVLKDESTPGVRVHRRIIDERAPGGSVWHTTSDIETTEEDQFRGWVRTKEVIDPDGEALTSTWTYYQPGAPAESLGRLQHHVRHDGYESTHTYALHTKTVTTPYAGVIDGKTTTTTWNPVTRTRTVESTVGGEILSRTITTHTDTSVTRTVETGGTPLVTTTHQKPAGTDFGGKPLRTLHPDGTLTTHSYERDATTGGYTVTMENGSTTDDLTVVDGLRTITTYNSRGTVILRKTQAVGFGDADDVTYDVMAVTSIDDLGRPLTTAWHPTTASVTGEVASATGEAWTTTTEYSCCGVSKEIDQYGIPTFHAYDSLQRRIKTHRIGVTTETVRNGLTVETHRYAQVVNGSLSATLTDNDANLVGKSTRNLTGTSMTSSSPDPTSATPGDLVDTTTTVTYQPDAGLSKRVVVTTPDTFSQTTDYCLDGRTYETTGVLSPEMRYTYSVNATGELTSRSYLDEGDPRETTSTQSDRAGRTVAMTYADSATASMDYNALGQLEKSVDPDGVTTLMAYNDRGERVVTAIDLPVDENTPPNGQIDYGTDQVSFSETTPALDANDAPVWQTVSKVWQDDQTSAAAGTVVSTSLRSPDGLSSSSRTVGVANPSTSLTALGGGGDWTVTSTNPDGSYTVATYVDGLMDITEMFSSDDVLIASTAMRDATEAVGSGYDALNRPIHRKDSRTGVTTTAYKSATADVAASVTDPGTRVTAFTYDIRGRRTHVNAENTFDPAGDLDNTDHENVTVTAYNPDGTVGEITGDQTYRTTYTYDHADRMKTMTTYGSSTAITTWTYSTDRGFMTRKEHHDGEGTDYTYTAAGRLATRTWARGVVTTYGYDDGGRLTSTDYSDTTPDLVFTHDALGRQKTVTRGGVLHAAYDYAPADLVLSAERQQIDTLNRTVERSYDIYRRPTGYLAGTPDGTDPFVVAAGPGEAAATWTRDLAGRLDSVTDGSQTFTYGYTHKVNGAGNHVGATSGTIFESTMPFTLDGPEVDTVLEYDATRGALLGRENTYDDGLLSSFAYSVNQIGQRDGLTTDGDAFATDLDWGWSYNARGELVQAKDKSAEGRDRAYQYDGIGNRLFSETSNPEISDPPGPGTTAYTANALNQYTAIGSLTPAYDTDGNLTSGPLPAAPATASSLAWDAENRLVSATVGTTTTTYAYDHQSRLISATTGATTVHYLYDGWNRIAEYNSTTNQTAAYLWGLDLSGTPQGAGGVGALLSISAIASGSVSDTFYPAYDGNGNVSEYVDAAGDEVAHFEYDPFGNLTVDTEGNAASFPYRFSTKPQDLTTGLYYYGYRWYDPVTGRWPSRDPIEERGGLNLYGFVGNEGVSRWDYLGMRGCCCCAEEIATSFVNDNQKGTWVHPAGGEVGQDHLRFDLVMSFQETDHEGCSPCELIWTEGSTHHSPELKRELDIVDGRIYVIYPDLYGKGSDDVNALFKAWHNRRKCEDRRIVIRDLTEFGGIGFAGRTRFLDISVRLKSAPGCDCSRGEIERGFSSKIRLDGKGKKVEHESGFSRKPS